MYGTPDLNRKKKRTPDLNISLPEKEKKKKTKRKRGREQGERERRIGRESDALWLNIEESKGREIDAE